MGTYESHRTLVERRIAQLGGIETSSRGIMPIVQNAPKGKQFSKMSPSPLKKFINFGLTKEQKRDIKSIGFESLLSLKTEELPSDLCRWLLRHYNAFSSCLEFSGNKLDIEVDDFHIALGLPNVGNKVLEAGNRENTVQYNELVNEWLQHLGRTRNNVIVSDILEKMKHQTGGGEHFKRNFVVLVVSTLIKGNKKGLPNYKIMKSLGDVDSISNLNWCQYALECLTDCAEEWTASDGTSLYTGPILPLVLCYMDRVTFMGRSINRKFPLISCWTRKDVFDRRDFELKKAGGFGAGVLKPRLVYDNEHEVETLVQENQHVQTIGDGKKACLESVAKAAKELSKAYNDFLQVMEDAKLKFPKHDVIDKLDGLATTIAHLFNGCDNVTACVNDANGQQAQTNAATSSNANTSDYQVFSEDDALFSDPTFLDAIDAMVKSFQKRPLCTTGFDGPSFDLGIDFSTPTTSHHTSKRKNCNFSSSQPPRRSPRLSPTTNQPITNNQEMGSQPLAPQSKHKELPPDPSTSKQPIEPDPNSNSLLPTLDPSSHNQLPTDAPTSSSKIPSSYSPSNINKKPTLHAASSNQPLRRSTRTAQILDISHVDNKRALGKREVIPSSFYKSPFIIRNVNILKDTSQVEKSVADWVFSNLEKR